MSVDIKVYTTSNANLKDPQIEFNYINIFQVLNREEGSFDTYYRIMSEPAAHFKESDIQNETLGIFDCYVWDKDFLGRLPKSPLKERILRAAKKDSNKLIIFQPF